MIIRRKLSSICLLAILTLSICILGMQTANAQTTQTDSKLQAANTAVNQALIKNKKSLVGLAKQH